MAIDFVYEDEKNLSEENYEQQFIEIIEKTLEYLKIEDDVELSCIIINDDEIHAMNRDYRQIDRSTDVIVLLWKIMISFMLKGCQEV